MEKQIQITMELNGTEIVSPLMVNSLSPNKEEEIRDLETITDEGVDVLEEADQDISEKEIADRILSTPTEKEDKVQELLHSLLNDDDNENENAEHIKPNQNKVNHVEIINYLSDRFDIDLNELYEENNNPNIGEVLDYIGYKIEENLQGGKQKNYRTKEAYLLDEILSQGGSVDEFYNDYVLASNEVIEQLQELHSFSDEDIVLADFMSRGFSEEEAVELLEGLEAKNKVKAKAQEIKRELEQKINTFKNEQFSKLLNKKHEELLERKKQIEKVREEEMEQIANKLYNLQAIYGYPLVEEDKERLFAYITQTDENGLTELDKALQSNENLILVSFILNHADDFIGYLKTAFKERSKKIFYDKLLKEPYIPQNKVKNAEKQSFIDEKLNEY